jgi:hypothetical protein
MNRSKEDNVNPAEKHERPEEEPQLVPPDLDLGVTDDEEEEKKEGNKLPPAKPPMI